MALENPLPDRVSHRPGDVAAPSRCSHLRVDHRGFPVIAAIPQAGPGDEDFGGLSEQRKLVLATYDLCAICALPFRDELRWQVTFGHELAEMGETPLFNEAPVHEVCALYAAQVCPFVSSPYARFGDALRKGMRRGDTLLLAGFERTSAVFGQESAIQAGTYILMFEMSGLARTHRLANAAEARKAYEEALAAEAVIVLDEAEQRIVDILGSPTSEGEDSGYVMAGAAWVLGAAFCSHVRDIQAMRHMAEARDDFYFQLAGQFLFEPGKMAAFEDAEDPSFAAATMWFRSRQTLPAILQQWREDGARRIRDSQGRRPRLGSPPPAARRDEAATRRRKEAEKARRKSRRRK